MKSRLNQIKGLNVLKRNEKLNQDCCYILSSETVAKNTYFKTKRDVLWAHKMINKHLNGIMDIIDYLFTPHGWMLVVTVKSEEEILHHIKIAGYSSGKINRATKDRKISVIISECIRYAISGIARITNRYNKRYGSLVCRNFSRFIFEDMETAELVMKKMKGEQIKLCHQQKRYRPSLSRFDIAGEFKKKGDVFLCSKNYGKLRYDGSLALKCIEVISKSYSVLREFLNITILNHFSKKHSSTSNLSPQNTSY